MAMVETLYGAGFSFDEISDYMAAERQKLTAAGFTADEIAAEFGTGAFAETAVRGRARVDQAVAAGEAARGQGARAEGPPPANAVRDHVVSAAGKAGLDPAAGGRLAELASTFAEPGAEPGADDARPGPLAAGFQQSVTGLIARGRLPDPPRQIKGTLDRVLFQLGALGGDLPAMIAGGLIGTTGIPDPTDVVTVPAGALALPAGMREVLMQAYDKGAVVSWRDFFERSLAVTWETVKGGLTGAVVGRTGQVAPLAAKFPAQVATLVTVGAGLEGRVPEPEEFLDAAIVIGGLHAVGAVAPKLRNIYARTGRRPADVAQDAAGDPALKAELLDPSPDLPSIPGAYRAEAARQAGVQRHVLDEAIEGLRSALDDPAKLDALQKARPEIRDIGQVSAMIEDLQAERGRMAALEPPAIAGRGERLPPVLREVTDETFLQWVRTQGGISADEYYIGEVRNILDKDARTVVRKQGIGLDELTTRAWEEGWFDKPLDPEFTFRDRPGIEDFLELLARAQRQPLYRAESEARSTREYQAGLEREIEELAVEARGLTDQQLFAALENARREHLRDLDEVAKGEYYAERYKALGVDVRALEAGYGEKITREEYARLDAEISAAEGPGGHDRSGAERSGAAGGPAAAAGTIAERADRRSQAGRGELDPATAEAARGTVGLEPGLTEPRLKGAVNEAVVDAAEELLLAGRVVRDQTRLLSDQVMELLQTERIRPGQYQEILDRHGVAGDDFAQLWRADTRKAAQHLQQLSAVEAKINRMTGKASEADIEILRRQGIDAEAEMKGLWRRLDDLRRAGLVTQLATAARNFETQVARVGVDVLQRALDAAIQKAMPEARRTTHPADAFEVVLRLFDVRGTRDKADAILARFPKEADDLFMRFSSDLTRPGLASDALAKAERAVWFLNGINRFQEYAVRRPVFVAELDMTLNRRGESLERIIAENRVGAIERAEVAAAVEKALEMTWAKGFSPHATGAEGVAGKFISLVNALPGLATVPFPFPRFLMNAVKFQYEFSPAGFLKLLSAEERARIAQGDTSAISRAAIGTAMLFAAWQIRDSDWAGEKWWELKLPGGETVSLLPFNPFVFHLFVADVVKRHRDGTLASLTTKDLAFGFLSSNFRAGGGLYILDALMEGVVGLRDPEKALEKLAGLAGETLSGFLVPLQTLADVFTEFDAWLGSGQEAVIRDRRTEPFLGPFKDKIPLLKQTLPEAESPTREAPLRRQMPALRQATGLGLREAKNPAEAELDRLGFTRQEIAPTTGDAAADRAIAKFMGPLVEAVLVPLVATPFYQGESNEVKGGLLRLAVHGIRHVALTQAKAEDPQRFRKIRLDAIPRRERLMLESLLGADLDALLGGAEQQ